MDAILMNEDPVARSFSYPNRKPNVLIFLVLIETENKPGLISMSFI